MGVEPSRQARFDDLYRRHAAAVAAYALRRVARDVAEDVVSEVFVVAWRRLDEVPEHALPWLFGVARHTVANHRRSSRRRVRLEERLRVNLGEVSVTAVDRHLLDALQTLREGDREMLLLVAWEGLSIRGGRGCLRLFADGLPDSIASGAQAACGSA